MSAIRVKSVVVDYGSGAEQVRALQDVTASFAAAQLACIMGPSGSGKSTLLSVLAGLRRPSSGEVWMLDQRIDHLSPRALADVRRRSVGLVFQHFRLLQHVNVADNLRVAAEVIGIDRAEHLIAAERALDAVGLRQKARRRLTELSGGEKQRVAIARALLGRPAVILADEPTAALDRDNVAGCLDLLRVLAASTGCAVVIVTHDQRVAERCDVLWAMEDGVLARRS
jgi:putative ABC transport system ATP-binding protein